MCEFFSCIVTRDGKLWFTEDDSHEAIIRRKGLRDVIHNQHFVRLEIKPPFNKCTVDQDDTPSWFDDQRAEIESNAVHLAKRIGQARAEYEKVEGPAWAKYKKAQGQAWAEYEKAQGQAWAEYEKAQGQAWAEYEKVIKKIEGFVCK